MKFIFYFVFFIIGLNKINGECELKFVPGKSPIFIPPEGTELLLDSPYSLIFGNNNYVKAICPSGFQEFEYKQPEDYYESYKGNDKVMFLRCINGEIQIQMNNRFLPLRNSLSCINANKSEVFVGAINENCDKKLYTINLNTGNFSLDFADVCFDLEIMRINYLHYVTKQVKPISYQQFEYNEDLQFLTKTEAPEELFFIDEYLINDSIRNLIGYRIDFKYEEFYPSNYWNPHISDPLHNSKTLNRFLGWTNFIEGNWKFFRNLLAIRSNKFKYDVYLGTSGIIVAPANTACNKLKELQIEEFGKRITTVPKYVWTYLKSQENESNEFVVIGVNSPYFEFFRKNETIFCNDICDEIEWLKPLKKIRKLSTFGYMFCCRKEQVEYILDGFPKTKFITTTSTTIQPDDYEEYKTEEIDYYNDFLN